MNAAGPRVSLAVLTYNAAETLPALLAATRWATERIVVDSGSSDATQALARAAGAVVHERPLDNFAAQRNFALHACRGDWVLMLDADEVPSPAFVRELQARLANCREDAFRVRICSRIFGRRFRFSGTQDDRPIRLVRHGAGQWSGAVHETWQVRGAVGRLHSPIDHVTLPDLPTYLTKVNRYTTLAARERVAAGRAPGRSDRFLAPAREVFRRFCWKLGVLDGLHGWAFCALSGLAEWVLAEKHRRYWEAAHQRPPTPPPSDLPASSLALDCIPSGSLRMSRRHRADEPFCELAEVLP